MEIGFDLSGFSQYEVQLIRMIAMLTDLRLFWPRLVPIFVGWMRERFAQEGRFGGEQWLPLSPDYLARKAVAYPGKGILYATGDLRKAASLPKRIATPRSLTLIIDDSEYKHGGDVARSVAEYHQTGTDRMPARPLIPRGWQQGLLPLPLHEEVESAAQLWVDEMAHTLGLS